MAGDRLYFALAVTVYCVAAGYGVLLWARGFRRGEWTHYALLAAGFAFHTTALLLRGFTLNRCPVTNLYEATVFASWTVAGAYVAAGWWAPFRFASVLLAPGLAAVGLLALQPALDASHSPFDGERAVLSLHVTLVLLAYASFALAAAAAGMFLIREGQPGRSARELMERLPAVERLEAVLLHALAGGLILLTAGLVMSLALMRERYGVWVRPDPKIAWSVMVWGVYLLLVIARLGWRRDLRQTAWGALACFAFLILTFWGTNLLSPIHQS